MKRLPCLTLLLALAGAARADDGPVDFQRDIRPILSNHCFRCHGPAHQEGGARLDLRDAALKRKRVVPGNADGSLIIKRVTGPDADRMPPADAGERLTPTQVEKLRAWIKQGAEYTPHWSFVKPRAEPPPAVKDAAWSRNAIDRFILARLEKANLTPSPEAERTTLLRRVTLDLVGLTPTPQEIDDFLKASESNPDAAYEAVVDRVLASPHYGERVARPWLDMARYADSNGYTVDGERQIWLYRDWVVSALNRDLPFDQFTVEQLAGDLLPGATAEQKIATGFHRNTPLNEEGGTDPEQFRVERTIDRTNTTGAVWLGLTVGCAQCHSHKYDPISQKEYYQLYAFFNSIEEPQFTLTTPEQEQVLKEKKDALDKFRQEQTARAKMPGDKKADEELAAKVKQLQKEIKDLETTLGTTLVCREAAKLRASFVHLRGDFLNKGDPVQPGTFASLPPLPVKDRPANRLDLARWLVSEEQPLTPRVVVNRMWQHFFGRGLVETENDFGMQGTPPTHPELLDWLASEFVRRGWSTKQMHRLIVTSSAYRQSAAVRHDLREKDPNNYLLGRQNRLRLEAEIIRDAALSASGLISPRLGGKGVYPPQPPEVFNFTQSKHAWPESKGPDRYRRGLYTFIRRQSQHPLLPTFDGADAQTACTRRNRSNTPLQALHLANDPAFVEIAAGLGKRIAQHGPDDDPGKIDFAFRLCFARPPEKAEADRLLAFLDRQRKSDPATAWTMLARVLINLDEFITRE